MRRRLGKKGGAGLISALAPVVVGVLLAYAWNAAGTPAPHKLQVQVPAPYVGIAAEQAAAQAWARISPVASVSQGSGSQGNGSRGSGTISTPRTGGLPASYPVHVVHPGCRRILVVHQHQASGGAPAKKHPGATAAAVMSVLNGTQGSTAAYSATPSATGVAESPAPATAGKGVAKGKKGYLHGPPQRQGNPQCPSGWWPIGKPDPKSSVSPSTTAWPVRGSANAPLGSSAGVRVDSVQEARPEVKAPY